MAPRWTESELDVLRRLYPHGGSRAVHAALPHRSRGAIRIRAKEIRVRCGADRRRSAPRWTDAELDTLRRLYPTGGSVAVHEALPHRPFAVISQIAHRHGVVCIKRRRRHQKQRFDPADIMRAYVECGHDVRTAAAAIGCGIHTVYKAIEIERHRRAMAEIANRRVA